MEYVYVLKTSNRQGLLQWNLIHLDYYATKLIKNLIAAAYAFFRISLIEKCVTSSTKFVKVSSLIYKHLNWSATSRHQLSFCKVCILHFVDVVCQERNVKPNNEINLVAASSLMLWHPRRVTVRSTRSQDKLRRWKLDVVPQTTMWSTRYSCRWPGLKKILVRVDRSSPVYFLAVSFDSQFFLYCCWCNQ